MVSKHSAKHLIACIKCDALSTLPMLQPGQIARCPSCGGTLYAKKRDPIDRTLAVALAGMLLFFPAISLPIIGIGVAGSYNEASLLDCIQLMISDDFYIIAFCVFMFTIAIPFVRLFSAFYLAYKFKTNKLSPSLLVFFRSYHRFDNWTMVHVFLLGIIVSMYKLVSMADVNIGGGLISLILLLLCSTLISLTLDQHYIWQRLEDKFVSER